MSKKRLKREDLVVDQWYYIQYLPRSKSPRRFIGPAKFKGWSGKDAMFYSPLDDSESGFKFMLFGITHVIEPCSPLPTYQELLEQLRAF